MTRPSVIARVLGASVLCSLAFDLPTRATAQDADRGDQGTVSTDAPAHVSFVDGAAVLERDGQADDTPSNMPLLAGDRVRTQTGRVEILFSDGSTLHLDAHTTVDFQSDELVRLLDGRIRIAIPGPDRDVSYRIDAPFGSVQIEQPGEYRVAVLHGAREELELAVVRGGAALVNDEGRTTLNGGERAYARAETAPSNVYVFNSAAWDAFDQWSETRRDERRGNSAQYLPDQVRPYAASFDRYGSWRYDASYGSVWYPTVSTEWRPYYNGRWATLRPYGWTWVGSDPWAWPTHHYGRWGVSAGAWFWIPGRSWAPAWVSWAYAPGYVSWCPLGWNNRPIFDISINERNRGYDPWRAWTVVPQRHFGSGYVNAGYVGGRTFDARTRAAFVPRNSSPDLRGYAVPRAAAPIRVAGTAGRRGSSPVYTNLAPGASSAGRSPSRVFVQPAARDAGGGGTSISRPGYSGPGREPVSGRAAPRPADSPIYRADPYGRRAAESPRSDGRTQDRAPIGSRAVPRSETDRPQYGTPAPQYRGSVGATTERRAPSGEPRTPEAGIDQRAPGGIRAVPRAAPGTPRDTPQYRGPVAIPQQRSSPVSPRYAPDAGVDQRAPGNVRAVPRSAPDSPRSAPPQYRAPGGAPQERSAPASPRSAPPQYHGPVSAAPERRAPAAERPAERSRSGGQSSGTAVRRPGGGR
ncbi:MAG: DUF6600 domain-containing protein [Acidobacteriota bacterium]